jgi:steroid 5-alpha reductase family enzyme
MIGASAEIAWQLPRGRVLGQPVEGRCVRLRAHWGRAADAHFVWFFLAQALLALGGPLGWLGLTAPALILLFVLRFTGIPSIEKPAPTSRGDAYRAHQRTTSAFVSWFRREERAS